MSCWFEELDYRKTPMGELILQRRRIAALDNADACCLRFAASDCLSLNLRWGKEQP